MHAPSWAQRLRTALALPRGADDPFPDRPAQPRRMALAYAALYLLASLLWIVVTDRWVTAWASSAAQAEAYQLAKGIVFVSGSAVLCYLVLSRPLTLLWQAEQRWRHVMRALDDVTWVASPDGRRLLYLNQAAEAVYGRPPSDFLADAGLWLKLVHPDDRAAVARSSSDILAGVPRAMEYRIVRPDGGVRWLSDRASLILDAAGRAIAIAGVASDITEQRRLRDLQTEAHLRLDGIVASAMDAIITVDRHQTVKVFNQAASTVFGLPAEQALGQPLDRFICPGQRAAHREHVDAFARHGATSRRMGQLMQLSGLRADGSSFPMEASISCFGEGEQLLMTVILRDITEARRAEAAVRERVKAEAANQAKTAFLARMSHELRTPLNAVLGFSHLLLSNPSDPLNERQAARVEQIRVAGWHLLALIDDVLDLSRVESGGLAVASAPVVLAEVTEEAKNLCQALADKHQIAVGVSPGAGPPLLARADPLRLRQVLVNLLSNAIKYNRSGGTATASMGTREARVFVQIQDEGEGLTDEQLQHLFEPFNRLGREHGAVEGTGIGLVLTRQLVDLMGGDLQFTSRPGQGTTVTLLLPQAHAGTTSAEAARPVPGPAPAALRVPHPAPAAPGEPSLPGPHPS